MATRTQVKGARPAPLDFEVPREPRADGVAIITSSSASEAAQESASLGGSFFTHHLTLGLRGAADADSDGRVTLSESYRYAYHRTLTATSEAGVAPQHPTYAIRMAGKGEVVLVDLRKARSVLSFAAGSGRSYLVTHEKSMEVVAEVATAADPLRVALPAGRYRIERIAPVPRLTGIFELPAEGSVAVDDAGLTPVVSVAATSKGEAVVNLARTWVSAEPWIATPIMRNFGPAYGLRLGIRHDANRVTITAGLFYSQRDIDDDGFSYAYRAGALTAGAAYRAEFPRFQLLAGIEAGVAVAQQHLASGADVGALIPQAGVSFGIAVPIYPWLAFRVTSVGSAHTFRLNQDQVVRFSVQVYPGIDWGL